eukprot:scaffold3670_cov124-Cylindrotheca_fusiformis.AAC.28
MLRLVLRQSVGRGQELRYQRLRATNHMCWFSSKNSSNYGDKNDTSERHKGEDDIISAEWIPPSRPLHGDQDNSRLIRRQQELDRAEAALFTIDDESETEEETLRRLEEALALEEKLEQEREVDMEEVSSPKPPVDWMKSRRQALGKRKDSEPEVPVLHHQLLTETEVTTLLKSFGGDDIAVLKDDEEYPRMGGAKAMILCTAPNLYYVNAITKNLVDHLKERELQDLGVLGAKMGKGFLQTTSQNNWSVVDCQNYIVHVLDQSTREALNLEKLWSGKDPLWRLDVNNDDAVEDYVAEHHVPYSYGPNPDDIYSRETSSIDKLQRRQWISPHRPVIPTAEKLRDRRAERRRRRERRQQEAREMY